MRSNQFFYFVFKHTIVTCTHIHQISYESEGDIDEVYIGYRWFEFLSRLITGQRPSVWTGLPNELEYFVTAGLREELPQRLVQCFYGENQRFVANRAYFKQVDGMK